MKKSAFIFMIAMLVILTCFYTSSCQKDEPDYNDKYSSTYLLLTKDNKTFTSLDLNGAEIFTTPYNIVYMESPSNYYGYQQTGNAFRIIKNENTIYELEKDSEYAYGKMVVDNGNIYSAVRSNTNRCGLIYKNDTPLFELEESSENRYNYNAIVTIKTKDNDIYVCGRFPGDNSYQATLWKNGKILYTLSKGYYWDICYDICFKGDDVYCCGRDENHLVVWKNGQVLYQWPVNKDHLGDLVDIEIINGDIYTCGCITKPNNHGSSGVVYKNGEIYYEELGDVQGNDACIWSIKQYNNDIYFSGMVQQGEWTEEDGWKYVIAATLWKNKKKFFEKSFTSDICIANNYFLKILD